MSLPCELYALLQLLKTFAVSLRLTSRCRRLPYCNGRSKFRRTATAAFNFVVSLKLSVNSLCSYEYQNFGVLIQKLQPWCLSCREFHRVATSSEILPSCNGGRKICHAATAIEISWLQQLWAISRFCHSCVEFRSAATVGWNLWKTSTINSWKKLQKRKWICCEQDVENRRDKCESSFF